MEELWQYLQVFSEPANIALRTCLQTDICQGQGRFFQRQKPVDYNREASRSERNVNRKRANESGQEKKSRVVGWRKSRCEKGRQDEGGGGGAREEEKEKCDKRCSSSCTQSNS
ncbi:hypothetical protein GX51_05764 [Blastomyces parvus]|uniref:Uncharacterized protein n=1 Tax=Blastomyces parvus TaxID=2060905 RepID=A0A2B7WVD1_9EURO|nr:hypothetical protein GX51_05764 [Blastomyces parvus]